MNTRTEFFDANYTAAAALYAANPNAVTNWDHTDADALLARAATHYAAAVFLHETANTEHRATHTTYHTAAAILFLRAAAAYAAAAADALHAHTLWRNCTGSYDAAADAYTYAEECNERAQECHTAAAVIIA